MTEELSELKEKNLYRKFRILENLKGISATVEGKRLSLFCGNDYLGLSRHPKLIEAAKCALETHGVGMGSARLISGTSEWHVAVEKRIADFLGKEKALLFSNYLSLSLSEKIISYTKDFADNSFLLKQFKNKVVVTYPPISGLKVDKRIQKILKDKITRSWVFVIGVAARLAAEKGIEYLFEALPQIISKIKNPPTKESGSRHFVGKKSKIQCPIISSEVILLCNSIQRFHL